MAINTYNIHSADFTRNTPIDTRDMASRALSVRAETVNEQARTIDAVISTEQPVEVMDWNRFEVIREVLVTDGGEMGGQLPLLQDHYRSLSAVLGSVRNLRKEGGQWVGTLNFMAEDPAAERAWQLARQGHVKDVSVGYRVTESIDIPPGQTVAIDGRTWENKDAKRALRVSKRWMGKEVSMVPIGADTLAKMRAAGGGNTPNTTQQNNTTQTFTTRGTAPGGSTSQPPARTGSGASIPKETSMNPQLRKYLESIGLRADATEAQAQAFYEALGDTQRAAAEGHALRADAAAKAQPVTPAIVLPADNARQQVEAERKRSAEISHHIEQFRRRGIELTLEETRAYIESDKTPEAVASELLTRWYAMQTAPAVSIPGLADNGTGRTAAGKGAMKADTRAELTMAIARRTGAKPEQLLAAARSANPDYRLKIAGNIVSAADAERHLEKSDKLSRLPLTALLGRMLDLAGVERSDDPVEMIRSAVSTGTTSFIFTDSVNAAMAATFPYNIDTTAGWVEEVDVADFKDNRVIAFDTPGGNPKKLPRGASAEAAQFADTQETFKVARYAEQAVMDEQDLIDDSMGALSDIPGLVADKFARLRPNLVYAVLLANPVLSRDSLAVFHATHANLGTTGTALSEATLEAGINAMKIQRENGVLLGMIPQVLVVPQALQFVAERLVRSTERNASNVAAVGNFNALQNLVRVVADDRIGAAGVVDPDTGTTRTGSATNWYLAAQPRRTIRVAYRRGTNRLPVIRSFVQDKGTWGIGFDINMDIGVKIIGFPGLYRATGQA